MYIQEFDPNLIGLRPYSEVIQQPKSVEPLQALENDFNINSAYFCLIRRIVSVALILAFALVMAKIILMLRK